MRTEAYEHIDYTLYKEVAGTKNKEPKRGIPPHCTLVVQTQWFPHWLAPECTGAVWGWVGMLKTVHVRYCSGCKKRKEFDGQQVEYGQVPWYPMKFCEVYASIPFGLYRYLCTD